ncbi:hypothetical protein J6590_031823 [Homalodisca vitripennis]|nr:hypothetical protein J6590_031823 [Homalodisca vitripennis]
MGSYEGDRIFLDICHRLVIQKISNTTFRDLQSNPFFRLTCPCAHELDAMSFQTYEVAASPNTQHSPESGILIQGSESSRDNKVWKARDYHRASNYHCLQRQSQEHANDRELPEDGKLVFHSDVSVFKLSGSGYP